MGWCELGSECPERHVAGCWEFSAKGSCSKASCKGPHILSRKAEKEIVQVGEEGEQWMEDLMGEMMAGSSAMREREIAEESSGRQKGGDGFIRQDAFHPLQDEDYEYDEEEEEDEDGEEMEVVVEEDVPSYPSSIAPKPEIYEEEEMEYGEERSVASDSHDESDEEVESSLLRH